MSELKPCPFCGSNGILRTTGKSFWVQCNKYPDRNYSNTCMSGQNPSSGGASTAKEAEELWNKRDTSAIEADELLILARRFFGAGYSIGYGGADIIDTPRHFERVWGRIEADRIEKESDNA